MMCSNCLDWLSALVSLHRWKRLVYLVCGAWMFLCFAVPSNSHSAACCLSSTLGGVGRLRTWEQFALGVRLSSFVNLGSWNTQGLWRNEFHDFAQMDLRTELWGMVGLGKRFDLYGRLPWFVNYRASSAQHEWGAALGDIEFGARFELASLGEHGDWPGLAILAGVVIPTGRSPQQTSRPLASDVTTRGDWRVGIGVIVEKSWDVMFVQLSLGAQLPFGFVREDLQQTQRFGWNIQSLLTTGIEFVPQWVFALSLRFLWEDILHQGTFPVANTEKMDMGVGVALSWSFDAHWSLILSVDTGLFFSGWGKNHPGGIVSTLNIRYGHF
ncbi:MAG: hypothetical protein AAGJ35_00160 [Myxococcota bacterium]